jgi:hypothetical protein
MLAEKGGIEMPHEDRVESAWWEHRFWLQVLGDHARFLMDNLSPREKKEVRRAEFFIERMDALLNQARLPGNTDPAEFSRLACRAALDIRTFKLHLLQRHLIGVVALGMTPTFLNHMVSEVEEYLRILHYLQKNEPPPPLHPIHHHLVWLPDASGHANALDGRLDGVERRLKKKSRAFVRHFDAYYLKALEMAGYLRTCLRDFPALSRFNHEVEMEMRLFQAFLLELEEMELHHTVLDAIPALIPDHMFREECYYLHKLAQVTRVEPPECDPGKSRTE